MLISVPSVHRKAVDFGVIFPGSKLHHLFLHMKSFWSPFDAVVVGVLHTAIFGLHYCPGTDRKGRLVNAG